MWKEREKNTQPYLRCDVRATAFRANSTSDKGKQMSDAFCSGRSFIWRLEGKGGTTVVCKTAVNEIKEIVIWNKRKLKWTRTRQHIKKQTHTHPCNAFPYMILGFGHFANNCNLWTCADCWLIDGIRYKLHLRYWCKLVNWSISCAVRMENGSPRDWDSANHMTMWSELLSLLLILRPFVLSVRARHCVAANETNTISTFNCNLLYNVQRDLFTKSSHGSNEHPVGIQRRFSFSFFYFFYFSFLGWMLQTVVSLSFIPFWINNKNYGNRLRHHTQQRT